MPRFERVAEYRSNQPHGSYGGLFTGGSPPTLHAFDRPRMTIDKAYLQTTCVGRVQSTGHDVQVVEHEKVSVIIPTEGTIRTQFAGQHLQDGIFFSSGCVCDRSRCVAVEHTPRTCVSLCCSSK